MDPRPHYRNALEWTTGLAAAVTDDQMSLPTPCPEFDVRALIGHLVGTVRRARAAGEGRDVLAVGVDLPDLADPAGDFASGAAAALAVWEDDSLLDAVITVPWGTVPGRGVMIGYLNETLVHGWDLAVATGQSAEADPAGVGVVAAVFPQFLPADIRGSADIPFGAVVEPRPHAGPTERLANWSGRNSVDWLGEDSAQPAVSRGSQQS
ncbi:TIGR03086 family metal-binding protein [Rhodococcus sp. G-MC3]|uniref:TIGR03086 family metal-binding protein n=1 Tax=Rhodococcus sp. G-MC3 TaxID=3046209 RepID=UPI0024B8BAAC|nr:TIGR03086 family metal-binding protein [Rhodococcus sp. G-MC3]MDJ0392881.1 TIGR03086 family metal-binding protein [Rhodococcus sp. G-MC3]